jgi:hypothetical protein
MMEPATIHRGPQQPLPRQRLLYWEGSSTSAVTVIWTAASSGMSETPMANRA